jgi:hypothetical protein
MMAISSAARIGPMLGICSSSWRAAYLWLSADPLTPRLLSQWLQQIQLLIPSFGSSLETRLG